MKLLLPVTRVTSFILALFGLTMLLPLLVAVVDQGGNVTAYIKAIAITETLAAIGWFASQRRAIHTLTPRQMFLITTASWILICLAGALPLAFTPHPLRISDAVFESVSGLTTTGSTVLSGLDFMPRDLLLWRSMLQWIGGLGVIGMAVAILPFLKVGGMRLFQTESSDWSDKSVPRSRNMVTLIIYVYFALTLCCTLSYMLAGMDAFTAVNHAMTTISTGGFSTSDKSFAQFASLGAHWVAISFMVMGAIPFTLYVHFLLRRQWQVFNDQQLRGLFAILLLSSLMIAVYHGQRDHLDLAHALTLATFNLVSVVTTTGFASGDYSTWGPLALTGFFFAMFIGGCSGSTSGGIKVFRFQLFFIMLRESLTRGVHPRASLRRFYNGRPVDDAILMTAVAYIFLALISFVVITLALSLCGLDLVTSLTGSATAIMNVGPGLGNTIGPAGNFSSLPDTAKWILSAGMLLGRLEFTTVIIVLTPSFWRA